MSEKLYKQLKGTEAEYKCYGLYSSIAEKLGCNIADVDSVYSWYLETNLKGIIDEDSLQVMFRDLGALKINLSKAFENHLFDTQCLLPSVWNLSAGAQ